jgi:hypothetical protein
VRTPVRDTAISRDLNLRNHQRTSLQTIRFGSDGDITIVQSLNYCQSKAVKGGPGRTFVIYVTSGVSVAGTK